MVHWLEMWWIIGWRCDGYLIGDVMAHWLDMWWFIGWKCDGLLMEMRVVLGCSAPNSCGSGSPCRFELGCPNFASKKVSLQSETKRNANDFAWFGFLFAKLWKKNFASFRFVSL